jgi:hypothetical protein
MYKNFSSLSLFATGNSWHKKIQQINKLMGDYGVDLLAGCETCIDWRYITDKDDKSHNLFGCGQGTQGAVGHNINDEKIKRNQWGGTCVTTVGRLSAFVTVTGVDSTGLGQWSWVQTGSGGKTMRVIMAYQPVNLRQWTKGKTVWDQHVRYFEARGEIQTPWAMFCADLVSLLWQWKHSGDKIILLGDFNENVYTGDIATALSQDEFWMYKLCQQITGIPLPHTHYWGTIPIDCIYSAAGIDGVAVALLPSWIGMGDHRVFIVDVMSLSMMGDIFLHVLSAAGRLLNCALDRIECCVHMVQLVEGLLLEPLVRSSNRQV